MVENWVRVEGVVVPGHRVASGPSGDYPYGTLERQLPLFLERGLDLMSFFPGTLNISIQPLVWKWIRPQVTFRNVAWTDLHPAEDFSFSPCRLFYQGEEYHGYVYYPHPETKVRHFQDPSMIEVICAKIQGIGYQETCELFLDGDAIHLFPGEVQ